MCPGMYRGGGGIPRDSEYGYSKDIKCPPVGHFQLNLLASGASKRAYDATDLALLRRKFRVRSSRFFLGSVLDLIFLGCSLIEF